MKVMILKGVKLTFTEEEEGDTDEDFYFLLSHNKKITIFCLKKKEDFQNWLKPLTRLCILSNYSKYYSNVKVIGKGTFAKVLFAKKRNDDGKEYAVKTFDKKVILTSKTPNRTRVSIFSPKALFLYRSHSLTRFI